MSKRRSGKGIPRRREKKRAKEQPARRTVAPGVLREVWPEAAFLILAAAVALGPGLGGELLNWDDDRFIQNNELIREISLSNVAEIFSEPHFEAYQPLHLVSYLLDYQLFRLWAPGYKIHSFLLWCLDLVLLLLVLRRLGLGRAGAFAAVLVFAVHPLHVESVCWVTSRKDVLSLAFLLGSALLYLRSKHWQDRDGILSLLLFALALLTKSATVVLPGLLLLADLLLGRRPWREALLRTVPFALLAAGIGLYVVSLWEENEISRPTPENGALGHIALVGETYWHYLASMVWPAELSPVYPIEREGDFEWRVAAGFAAWIALVLAAWRSDDRRLLLGALWAAVALLPVSNIIPVYFFVQDRYTLIATIGAALMIGRGFEWAAAGDRGRRPAQIVLGLIVAALATVSAVQATYWRDSLSLWRRATAAQPHAYYAFLALGHTQRQRGEFEAAFAAYQRATELRPELPYARISLCLADAMRNVREQGRPEGEVNRIGSALRREWGSPSRLLRLSSWMISAGYHYCAQLAEERAFGLIEPEPRVVAGVASRWTLAGEGEIALQTLERSEPGAEPDPTLLEVRAQALALLGRDGEARASLRRSLELEPREPEALLSAARQLLERGRPELALLYADVAPEGELTDEWAELRERAQTPSEDPAP